MQDRRKLPRKDLMSYSQVFDLAQGQLIGFLTGMGAATADAAYGAVAAFGLTLVTDALLAQEHATVTKLAQVVDLGT